MQRLLLIDGDESNRVTLALLLEEEGFEVVVASSLAEAAKTLRTTAGWDAVLLDSFLRDGRGHELVPLIRECDPSAKVVAVSGGSVEEWARVRIDAALRKGMHFPEFVRGLRALLEPRG
jgi:CheY-like chemotaxis protein